MDINKGHKLDLMRHSQQIIGLCLYDMQARNLITQEYGQGRVRITRLPGVNCWAVQRPMSRGWFGSNKVLVQVIRVDNGNDIKEVIATRVYKSGYKLNTCYARAVILQLSGTCYFNTVINQLCLSQRTASIILGAMKNQVSSLSAAEQHEFYNVPLSLDVCPASFTWLDALRVMYAIICPSAPTLLASRVNGVRPKYNIMAQMVYASGERKRNEKASGGEPTEALINMLKKLGITSGNLAYKQYGAPKVPDILLHSYPHEKIQKEILHQGELYDVDSCSLAAMNKRKFMSGHAMAGIMCNGEASIVESNTGATMRANWVGASEAQLTAHINKLFHQHGGPRDMYEDATVYAAIYVKRSATGAECA